MTTTPEREALADLLRYAERNTCQHDETYRGGAIWTICNSCGRKWADDRGGFVPYEDPPEFVAARAALAASPAAGGVQPLTDEQIDECLTPLGMVPYSTLCGAMEIRDFARRVESMVLAATSPAAPAQALTQEALDPDELALFTETVEQFADDGETTTDYTVLVGWASRGLLECTCFVVTKKGRAALASQEGAAK